MGVIESDLVLRVAPQKNFNFIKFLGVLRPLLERRGLSRRRHASLFNAFIEYAY